MSVSGQYLLSATVTARSSQPVRQDSAGRLPRSVSPPQPSRVNGTLRALDCSPALMSVFVVGGWRGALRHPRYVHCSRKNGGEPQSLCFSRVFRLSLSHFNAGLVLKKKKKALLDLCAHYAYNMRINKGGAGHGKGTTERNSRYGRQGETAAVCRREQDHDLAGDYRLGS